MASTASESFSAADTRSGQGLMARTAVSVRLIAGAPVALVDHPRAERPGLDQVQPKPFGDRRQEGRAATDVDRIAAHAQQTSANAGRELVVAHRRIRLPRQHGVVKPAAAQTAAELV